jgi:hypothetical protein
MGRLEVAEAADRVVCSFCGNVHLLVAEQAPARAASAVDSEIARAIRNLKAEIASRTRALKQFESERLTQLGYAAMCHLGGAVSLFLSLTMMATHELVAMFVPLFLFACVLFWVGATRIRERINPSGEELYLQETIQGLQSRLRQLTEEVEQGRLAEASVGAGR